MNKIQSIKNIKAHSVPYQNVLISDLQDPKEATAYLNAALEAFLEDGNTKALLLALRNLAQVQGGLSSLAKKTNLNRQALYKMLSSAGNPRLENLGAVIQALGYRLTAVRAVHPKTNKVNNKRHIKTQNTSFGA